MKRKGYGWNIILLLVSVVIGWIIGEIVLTKAYPSFEGYYIYRPHLKKWFYPDSSALKGIRGKSLFQVNELGMRCDPVPLNSHYTKIIAIGGSTTECLYLDQRETWTSLLQDHLNEKGKYWVGNFSKPGLRSAHHYLQLKWILDQPTLRDVKQIVCLMGVNDLLHYLALDSAFFTLTEKQLYNWIFTYFGDRHKPFYKRSGFWKAAGDIKRRLRYKNYIQDQNGTIIEKWRNHRKRSTEINDSIPSLEKLLMHYRAQIKQIIALARENNIRLLFLTQPVLWQESKKYDPLFWLGKKGSFINECCGEYHAPSKLSEAMNNLNAALIKTCMEESADCLDLASLLPKNDSVFYDDCHFNENGARLVARLTANKLLNDNLAIKKVETAIGQQRKVRAE